MQLPFNLFGVLFMVKLSTYHGMFMFLILGLHQSSRNLLGVRQTTGTTWQLASMVFEMVTPTVCPFPKVIHQMGRVSPLKFSGQHFGGHFLEQHLGNTIRKRLWIICCCSRSSPIASGMREPLGTVAWQWHRLTQPLVCGHYLPWFRHESHWLRITQSYSTATNNSHVRRVLFNEFLHERQSPSLTTLSPFPCDMYTALDTVLIYATSTYILFQSNATFFGQLSDLLRIPLVQSLKWWIRSTLGADPNMLRSELRDGFESLFNSLCTTQVTSVPVRTSNRGSLIPSPFLNRLT